MSYENLERIIDGQRSLLKMKDKEAKKLYEENRLLKETLRAVSVSWMIDVPPSLDLHTEPQRLLSWSDRSRRFAAMRSRLLEVAIKLAKVRNVAIHQSEIIAEARQLHPNLKRIGADTLTARIRELCNPMSLLIRVKQGFYFPSQKALNL